MNWIKPTYDSLEINRAGKVLINSNSSAEATEKALEILDNWRASHSYPMHIFKKRLKEKALAVDPKALAVQRLKRVPAILKKLQRIYHGKRPSMKLYQMQDIGGCRAVLSNVPLARKLCEHYYLKGDLKHNLVGMKDYIQSPKDDGYRSIHLIYRYFSDKGKTEYNDLLTEIQIRSKLQHFWATAIETVGFFTRQALKSNEGEQEWMDFFRLVSSAFARMENCPPVPNTPIDEKELYLEIKKRATDLNVMTIMRGWMKAIKVLDEKVKHTPKVQYFLLELDIPGEKLDITPYTKENEQQALTDYAKSETRNKDKKEYDVVLVGADTSTDLKKAYPNYFVDCEEFLVNLNKIVKKYNGESGHLPQ